MAIEYPILDPANDEEMVEQALDRAIQASDGQLTDRSVGSVLRALVEGLVFPVAELLYYLNKLPRALALELFTLFGVSRQDETPAKGSLWFALKAPLGSAFTVPSGYVVQGPIAYRLTEALAIAPGALEGSVAAEAANPGPEGNFPPGGYLVSAPGFSQVQLIYNKEALTGGRSVEEEADFIVRAQEAVSSRDTLVTASDYAIAAERFSGCQAKVIPGLTADLVTEAIGHVQVFLAPEVGPASQGLCDATRLDLLPRVFAASALGVAPAVPVEIEVSVACTVEQVSASQAQAIFDAIAYELSPLRHPIGESVRVKRLEYLAQGVPGVAELSDLRIDAGATDWLPAQAWYYPVLGAMAIALQDGNTAKTYYQGNGIGITD